MKRRITAIQYNTYRGYRVERVVEDVKRAGFDGIELSLDDGWATPAGLDAEQAITMRALLRENAMQPVGLAAHTDLFAPNAAARLARALSLAELLQTNYLVTFLGTPPEDLPQPQADAAAAAVLRPFLPLLERAGIRLALEVHGAYSCGAAVLRVAELLDSPNVVINYDTANAIFYGNADVLRDFSACLSRIGYVHLKDKAGAPHEWNFPPLGQGSVPIEQLLHLLEQSGSDAPLAVEIEYTPQGLASFADAQQAARISASHLRQFGILPKGD